MNYNKIAKAVVNNLVNFGVGSASTSIVRNNMRPSDNPVVNFAISASVLVTGWAVSGTIMEPVRSHTDREIDKIADAIAQFKTNS